MNTVELEKSFASIISAIALLILGLLSILVGILLTIELLRHPDWRSLFIIPISICIVGALCLVAARSQRRLGKRAGYIVLLSLIVQLFVMSEMDLYFALLITFLQFAIVIAVAARFRSDIGIRIFLIGYILAGVSAFIYQRTGPAISVYGTECGKPPNHLCYGPVLGAGFPLQYVVDVPTISIPQTLNLEDNLRGPPLAIDILAYSLVILGSYKLVQSLRSRGPVLSRHTPSNDELTTGER